MISLEATIQNNLELYSSGFAASFPSSTFEFASYTLDFPLTEDYKKAFLNCSGNITEQFTLVALLHQETIVRNGNVMEKYLSNLQIYDGMKEFPQLQRDLFLALHQYEEALFQNDFWNLGFNAGVIFAAMISIKDWTPVVDAWSPVFRFGDFRVKQFFPLETNPPSSYSPYLQNEAALLGDVANKGIWQPNFLKTGEKPDVVVSREQPIWKLLGPFLIEVGDNELLVYNSIFNMKENQKPFVSIPMPETVTNLETFTVGSKLKEAKGTKGYSMNYYILAKTSKFTILIDWESASAKFLQNLDDWTSVTPVTLTVENEDSRQWLIYTDTKMRICLVDLRGDHSIPTILFEGKRLFQKDDILLYRTHQTTFLFLNANDHLRYYDLSDNVQKFSALGQWTERKPSKPFTKIAYIDYGWGKKGQLDADTLNVLTINKNKQGDFDEVTIEVFSFLEMNFTESHFDNVPKYESQSYDNIKILWKMLLSPTSSKKAREVIPTYFISLESQNRFATVPLFSTYLYQTDWNEASQKYTWKLQAVFSHTRFRPILIDFLLFYTDKNYKEINPYLRTSQVHAAWSNADYFLNRPNSPSSNLIDGNPKFGNFTYQKLAISPNKKDWFYHGRVQQKGWCWLCTAASVLEFHGEKQKRQCEYANDYGRVKGSTQDCCLQPSHVDCNPTKNIGASEILKDHGYETFYFKSKEKSMTFERIKRQINNGHLVLLGSPGHLQTIIGYAQDPVNRNRGSDFVLVWNTDTGAGRQGLQWMIFDSLVTTKEERTFTTYIPP